MYNFGMLTKFPKKNFNESQTLLDVLSSAGTEFYVELMGEVPSGYSTAVLSLIITKQLCLHVKLPPQAILLNTTISEEIKTNIVKRMIKTLEDEEFSDMTISSDDEDVIIKSAKVGEETEKKHSRRECTKLTKIEEMSSANLLAMNNSRVSVEQLFINASRLALFLLRHEYSISPFEKVCNAQDYVVFNTCQVYCHLTHNNNTDLPIIPPEIIKTRFSKRERKENESATKINSKLKEGTILEISKMLTYFLPPDAFLINQNYADQIEIMYQQYSPQACQEAMSILSLIYDSGVIGDWALITYKGSSSSCGNANRPTNNDDISKNPSISIVSKSEVDFECDPMQTCENNSISFEVQNVVISSSDETTAKVNSQAAHLPLKITKHSLSVAQKTEKSYFIPRTWRHLDGNLNKPVFFSLLSAVLSHIISVPGISSIQMCEKFSLIPPIQILELIEILEKISCVYKYFCKSKKASLFSSTKTVLVTTDPCPYDTDHLEPFPDALCKFALLRKGLK
ncbi:general transcription factor 3C polypeptide 1 [Trichonephila inaurata madagascariensis]|uniref:General transcription factor 3C polypeptide 1 n=1 Tax=Trichonephila inaurata madagascariensis TaxID=2747483 RepID=A0A8X6YR92_9ARAC|nr:general transcription factor 3C polypeptide 1 [Trichonephila inaurata madagascariensis]